MSIASVSACTMTCGVDTQEQPRRLKPNPCSSRVTAAPRPTKAAVKKWTGKTRPLSWRYRERGPLGFALWHRSGPTVGVTGLLARRTFCLTKRREEFSTRGPRSDPRLKIARPIVGGPHSWALFNTSTTRSFVFPFRCPAGDRLISTPLGGFLR